MAGAEIRVTTGLLIVLRAQSQPQGSFHEEKMPFSSLQELLDLCVQHAATAAFVRVQIDGESGGATRRLVLDVGHFAGQG